MASRKKDPARMEKVTIARYKDAELCVLGKSLTIGQVAALCASVGVRMDFRFVEDPRWRDRKEAGGKSGRRK